MSGLTFPCDACGAEWGLELWEGADFPPCPSCGWPMDRAATVTDGIGSP